ncbi:MAG TPA: PEGA domain-containing protein [Candidatus Binatia bacterium]|nr:PEGA domain-containing protein [Candidatus Binatia bacterium]
MLFFTLSLPPSSFAQHMQTADLNEMRTSRRCSASGALDIDFSDSAERTKYFSKTKTCVFEQLSNVDRHQLDRDEKIVSDTYPQVQDFYLKRGYSREDAAKISVLAWAEYRTKNKVSPLSPAAFIQLSTSFGQLTINSTPAGANIEVDTDPWDDLTKATNWTAAGKHVVSLKKDGCKDATGEVQVSPGKEARFERTLVCR